MRLILPLVLPALLGYLCVHVLLADDKRVSVAERLAYAYPLGIGMITVQMFFLGLAGFGLRHSLVASLVVVELAVAAAWAGYLRLRPAIRQREPVPSCAGEQRKRSGSRALLLGELLLAGWIAVKLASIFLEASLRPIFAFDAFVNWSVRAKLFLAANGLLLDPRQPYFFGGGVIHSSANYPPLNPLAQVWMAQWLGGFDEILVKFWTPVFLLAAALFLFQHAARELGRPVSLVLVMMLVSSPLVAIHATETLSDLPLAVYILFALQALQQVARGRRAYLPLAGLFAVCAIYLKGEGTFFAIPFFLACVVAGRSGDGNRQLRTWLLPLLLPYLLAIPWFVFRGVHHLQFGMDEMYRDFVFRPIMLWDYLWLILGLQNFNVVFLAFPLLLALAGRFDRELLLPLFALGSYVCFFLLLYVCVAFYSDNGRFTEGVFRNALTYYPATLLLTAALLQRILPRAASR